MRKFAFLFAIVAVGAAFAGCSDKPEPSTTGKPPISLNGPSGGGAAAGGAAVGGGAPARSGGGAGVGAAKQVQ